MRLPPALRGPMSDPPPSPPDSALFCAVVIASPSRGELLGKLFELHEGEHVFGRKGQPGVIDLDDRSISRRHMRIIVEQGAARLEDLGSMNGTRVNDERVSIHTLREGDRISLASVTTLKIVRAAPR